MLKEIQITKHIKVDDITKVSILCGDVYVEFVGKNGDVIHEACKLEDVEFVSGD